MRPLDPETCTPQELRARLVSTRRAQPPPGGAVPVERDPLGTYVLWLARETSGRWVKRVRYRQEAPCS